MTIKEMKVPSYKKIVCKLKNTYEGFFLNKRHKHLVNKFNIQPDIYL